MLVHVATDRIPSSAADCFSTFQRVQLAHNGGMLLYGLLARCFVYLVHQNKNLALLCFSHSNSAFFAAIQ
jgi:hypothetical protein